MTIKWALVMLFPLLLGFSTVDNVKYIAEYDLSEIEAEQLLKNLESFAVSQGFVLKKRIKETIPKIELVSVLQSGARWQGGVDLELTLDEGNQQITLSAKRYHGGCTRADSIEKIDEYITKFQMSMKTKYGINVNLKQFQENQ